MRKAGDVITGNNLGDREIVVIVDDRDDKEKELFPRRKDKAKEEIQIISSLVSALPLTNLIENTTQQTQTAH